ncbi:hypothetical protein L7F22_063372 [Adiantum nelumboides]|nr:hypothetical protein [Adiantum nelumboides]
MMLTAASRGSSYNSSNMCGRSRAVSLSQLYQNLMQLRQQLAFLLLCVAAILLLLFSTSFFHAGHQLPLSCAHAITPCLTLHRHLAFSRPSSHEPDSQQASNYVSEQTPTISANSALIQRVSFKGNVPHRMDAQLAASAGIKADIIKDQDISTETPLLGPKVTDWDSQRRTFLAQNPHLTSHDRTHPNILLVTGSRPTACENPSGDHSLLIFMKNKVDYCRLHGIHMFYNTAQLNVQMTEYWSKLPLLRTLMLSHPEMEWLWWMDSDAMITDMSFELPMEKYEQHNLIIQGNREEIFVKRSWLGLNAGIFLIRNCQWSLDLIDTWALMGPKDTVGHEWGKILSETLPDRPLFDSDDQSSLIYLLLSQTETWESKIVVESSYCLHGYWIGIVDRFEKMMESSHPGYGDDRWPFVTHFVGCKPCGRYPSYEQERCLEQMERAFNFADNQVLQYYGFQHKQLNTGEVKRI